MEELDRFMEDVLENSEEEEKAVVQRGDCVKFVEEEKEYCLKEEWENYQKTGSVDLKRKPCCPEDCGVK